MIPGLVEADVVAARDGYVIYRRGMLVGLSLHGAIDDTKSNLWRHALESEVMRAGFAEFYVIDGSEMIVKNSLGSRVRSALFVRKLMSHARFAVLHARGVKNPTAAMRTLLRAAGIADFLMCSDEAGFAQAVAELLLGQLPAAHRLR